ncbi:MAG: type II toxin-antitoxin system VapC family toxin [Actinomycetota bacterium]|nr:type II toxin-antitoxin system VapC family toxin [Actinomycetota bacterium]
MIVLDASAAVAVLLNIGPAGIRERLEDEDDGPHVPHIFEIEVLNALRHHARRGLSTERNAKLLEDLMTMNLTRYPHSALLPRIWELRENVTAYAAAYITLAETLNAPLITTDAKLARASGIRAEIELYE